MALFDVDSGQLYFEEHGKGDPPLVFVHGLACAQEDWRDQIDYFAASHHVVSLDQRGHGRSSGFTSGFDIIHFGADVAALIADRDLPPAVLVGHSMGCRVVLECARTAPQCVAGMVLIDGSRIDAPSADVARRATAQAMQAAGYEAFFEKLFTQMFTAESDDQIRYAILARAKRLPRTVGLELTPQMFAWDAEFACLALENLKVPVTVLQSTHLDETRERKSLRPGESTPWLELIRTLTPHAEVAIVPGVGHFTMIEAARTVNRHIEALLSKVRAA